VLGVLGETIGFWGKGAKGEEWGGEEGTQELNLSSDKKKGEHLTKAKDDSVNRERVPLRAPTKEERRGEITSINQWRGGGKVSELPGNLPAGTEQ